MTSPDSVPRMATSGMRIRYSPWFSVLAPIGLFWRLLTLMSMAAKDNRDLGFDVNCRGAINVARAAKQHDSRLLFLSTDYVFDGTKTTPYATDDPRSPRSVYGQSKAEAEMQLGGESFPTAASFGLRGFLALEENVFLTPF